MEQTCNSCGTANPAEAKFCMSCGAQLERRCPSCGTPAPEQAKFCMNCGSTLDPESVKALVDGALRRLGEEVTRYGGTVDKYIGDNVMAIFGAPVAHEDDEERAVRAALGMQEAMSEVNERAPEGVTFALRVGLNTGEVLAGAVGDDYTVV